jgi:c-di-GMP-binding flagellar brake protein YcgR
MNEKRQAERLKELNEVTIYVISKEKNIPKEKISYNYSEDISVSGAKIRGNILLPVDTLLKIDFRLKALKKQITAIGKIKWIKVIIEDAYYEAGVEFVNTPSEAIKKIENYISWKQKGRSLKPFWIFTKYNDPKPK